MDNQIAELGKSVLKIAKIISIH